jgi:hypothetical protein
MRSRARVQARPSTRILVLAAGRTAAATPGRRKLAPSEPGPPLACSKSRTRRTESLRPRRWSRSPSALSGGSSGSWPARAAAVGGPVGSNVVGILDHDRLVDLIQWFHAACLRMGRSLERMVERLSHLMISRCQNDDGETAKPISPPHARLRASGLMRWRDRGNGRSQRAGRSPDGRSRAPGGGGRRVRPGARSAG